jgi:hypothetical protein
MRAGEATNAERSAFLEAHRDAVRIRLDATARNLELVEWKIGFYKERVRRT